MKTSLDLPPDLVAKAKKRAIDETSATGARVTLRELVIRGLTDVLKAPIAARGGKR